MHAGFCLLFSFKLHLTEFLRKALMYFFKVPSSISSIILSLELINCYSLRIQSVKISKFFIMLTGPSISINLLDYKKSWKTQLFEALKKPLLRMLRRNHRSCYAKKLLVKFLFNIPISKLLHHLFRGVVTTSVTFFSFENDHREKAPSNKT